MSVLLHKSTWRSWLLGVFVWAVGYLLYVLVVHHTLARHHVTAALVSALVGASITSYDNYRNRRKSQLRASTN